MQDQLDVVYIWPGWKVGTVPGEPWDLLYIGDLPVHRSTYYKY